MTSESRNPRDLKRTIDAHRDLKDRLERPGAPPLYVPEVVRLKGEWLVWKAGRLREVRPQRGLLEEFLQLDSQRPDKILEYATQWGVLGLCEHGLPATHHPIMSCLAETGSAVFARGSAPPFCRPIGWNPRSRSGREPVALWDRYMRSARHLVEESARLRGQQQRHNDSEDAWFDVAVGLQKWLMDGDVHPVIVSSQDGRFEVHLRPWSWPSILGMGNLVAGLAILLLEAVGGAGCLLKCDGCPGWFTPDRQPRAGEMHYCQTCRKGKVDQKLAQRRHREGKRRQRHSPQRPTR
jgi:hypothetical protein